MIDIVTGDTRYLKNIRQMGTPAEEEKVYIEDRAYQYIHNQPDVEKAVYILMGHTEFQDGKYATFVENAFPVAEVTFNRNVPCWNNKLWSTIFKEVRTRYEESIIVGWALDLKNYSVKMTPELEAVHREQFGGLHQLFLLCNSAGQEESIYASHNNHLEEKKGFYIYYDSKIPTFTEPVHQVSVEIEQKKEDTEEILHRGQYRQWLRQQKQNQSSGRLSFALVIILLLLVTIIGVGVFQQESKMKGLAALVETFVDSKNTADISVTEKGVTQTGGLIPVLNASSEVDTQTATEGTTQPDTTISTEKTTQTYTVQKGESVTSICKKIYGDDSRVKEILEMNSLNNPDEILVGQTLLLP